MAKKKRAARKRADTGRPSDGMQEAIFERLQKAIDRKGISYFGLAKQVGCDPSYFSKMMSRKSGGRKYMPAVARTLGVRYDWLMHGEGEMLGVASPRSEPAAGAQVEVTVGDSVVVLPWNGGPLGLRII